MVMNSLWQILHENRRLDCDCNFLGVEEKRNSISGPSSGSDCGKGCRKLRIRSSDEMSVMYPESEPSGLIGSTSVVYELGDGGSTISETLVRVSAVVGCKQSLCSRPDIHNNTQMGSLLKN